jgi:hypothetical protein
MLTTRARLAASTRLLPSSALLRRGFGKSAIVAGLLITSLPNAMAQMTVPAAFAVTSTGGANYKIPIVVPPGTAGMAPSLSIEYSSETGGNASGWLGAGLLGVGWSLGGLSAVARCSQTVAQDGVIGAVTYTQSDRFCLEGQRLIAITSGTYGADGMQYGTEVESFSLIISHGGTTATGPDWFEVHTKSGQMLEFGHTPDSHVLAQGTNTARSWAVNKVSDTVNNYFTVTYQNDASNLQAYPIRIDYTGNSGAGLAPYNSVRFVYSMNRPDVVPIYHAGSLIQTTALLTHVQTYADSTFVADYQLLYQQGSATGRSQLASVTLCDGGDPSTHLVSCLPATSFTWQNGTTTPTVISNVANADGDQRLVGARPYLADFNGNGRTAILWDKGGDAVLPYSTGTDTRVLWSFTGTGSTVTSTYNFAGIDNTALTGYVPIVGDYNRDGRADIWWYELVVVGFAGGYAPQAAGPTYKLLSNNDGTYSLTPGEPLPVDQFNFYRFLAGADLNGDGRSDLIWIHQVTSNETAPVREWLIGPGGSVSTSLNDAGPVAASNNIGNNGWLSALGAADFNGDGFSDLLWTSNGSLAFAGSGADGLWLSNGNGNFTPVPVNDANHIIGFTSVAGYTPFFGDFNGDAKTDILWVVLDGSGRSSGQPILWTSRGNGTFVANSTLGGLNGSSVSGDIPTVADFNGDGISDILWVPADSNGLSSGQPVLWLGKGDGTFTVSNFGSTLAGYVPYLGDFNGDGKADVLWDSRGLNDSRSTGTRKIWLSDGVAPDLMTGVTNGLQATVTITYNSITNNNASGIIVYTKGTTATDPTVDVQAPMQVVSRVDKSNGVGDGVFFSTTYAYKGAQFDDNGRGFLGFNQVTAKDLQTTIVQTTTFLQNFPFIMQVASDTKTFGSTILSATTNTYNSIPLAPTGSTHSQVQLVTTQTSGTDLDGVSVLPTTTSTFTYDAYNNARTVTVSVSDGSTKTTTNTFTNDPTKWLLGRLITSSVTSTAP